MRPRRLVSRLAQAFSRLQVKGEESSLSDDARWLLRTRLIFFEKNGSNRPRPIRIGEFLRALVCRRLLQKHANEFTPALVAMRQWGVRVPGGAEALVHRRGCVEELARAGIIPPLVAFDIDCANMFGSIEWEAIRRAMGKHCASLLPWTEWAQTEASEVVLPSGEVVQVDRGAEQGDTLGPLQASLALGERMHQGRDVFRASAGAQNLEGAVDEWFMDDGQAFVRPDLADIWLRTIDDALHAIGASRSAGDDCKSVARLFCQPEAVQSQAGRDTEYIHATCQVQAGDVAPKVLGTYIGDENVADRTANRIIDKVAGIRKAVSEIDHAPTELVLTRRCLDVSRLFYALRCQGDRISTEALAHFDEDLRAAVEDTLGGELSDVAWLQATLGVQAAGLGLREAGAVALPAFIASRVISRPLVAEMAAHTERASIADSTRLLDLYDRRTGAAMARLLEGLGADTAARVESAVRDAQDGAQSRWESLRRGFNSRAPHEELRRGLVERAGEQDAEHPGHRIGTGALKLQRKLGHILDGALASRLGETLRVAGRSEDVRRLDELTDPSTNHEWLWRLSRDKGGALAEVDFVPAVRLRPGSAGPDDPLRCGNWRSPRSQRGSCFAVRVRRERART